MGNPRDRSEDSHYQGYERLCKKDRAPQRKRQESGRIRLPWRFVCCSFDLGSRSSFAVWRTNQRQIRKSLARPVVDSIVSDKLTFFLMENGELASNLIRKAIEAGMRVKPPRKARDESRNGKKNKKDKGLLSGKLTPAQSKILRKTNSIWSKETQPAVLPNKDGTGSSKRFFHFVGRFLILRRPIWVISSRMGNQHHDLHHRCWSWGRFLCGRRQLR